MDTNQTNSMPDGDQYKAVLSPETAVRLQREGWHLVKHAEFKGLGGGMWIFRVPEETS